ncbi:MAG: hypothetical protein IJX62_02555, partial [Clostridia bacterium]|nr:hypothetical protein [Clostridia bacterium]
YLDSSDEWHTYYCETCDMCEIEVSHEFWYEPLGQYTHMEYCHCGYMRDGDHIYTAYVNSEHYSYHYAWCSCGTYKIQSHVLVNSAGIMQCRYCGNVAETAAQIANIELQSQEISNSNACVLSNGWIVYILSESGSYMLPDGTIILSEEDAALADAGLLDPYELVESVTVPSNPGEVTE